MSRQHRLILNDSVHPRVFMASKGPEQYWQRKARRNGQGSEISWSEVQYCCSGLLRECLALKQLWISGSRLIDHQIPYSLAEVPSYGYVWIKSRQFHKKFYLIEILRSSSIAHQDGVSPAILHTCRTACWTWHDLPVPTIMVAWGLIMTLMCLVNSYTGLIMSVLVDIGGYCAAHFPQCPSVFGTRGSRIIPWKVP